ncbi:iron complex outermembrane recepter protein [Gammaproteobacteria bacterium]
MVTAPLSCPHLLLVVFCLLASLPFSSLASEPEKPENKELWSTLTMEDLVNVRVISATGNEQMAPNAPAVISVIAAEDIAFWQYQSVAEALERVPGFYCINDYLSFNCGVRGVNGGLRAYSRVIKVMINGQNLASRADNANYLGPELLPIQMVERIEVIRGPASALYGADAFLGVVNIITKKASDVGENGRVDLRAHQMAGSPGFSQAASVWGTQDKLQYSLAVSHAEIDRSGLKLSKSLPVNAPYLNPRLIPGAENAGDVARPLSFFGQLDYRLDNHHLTLDTLYSRLDNKAEFLDFGALSHDNRVSLDHTMIHLSDDWQITDRFELRLSAAHNAGGQSNDESLSFGNPDTHPARDFGFRTLDLRLEGRYHFGPDHVLTLGMDRMDDSEKLVNVFVVNPSSGVETQTSSGQGTRDLRNTGFYVQYARALTDQIGLTLNARDDEHNIYGKQDSYRAGLTYKAMETLNLKLLYGSAFKSPSAMQLYAYPLFAGEVKGNPALKPEFGKTLEFALDWQPTSTFSVSLNAFHTFVDDKTQLISDADVSQIPVNMGHQKSNGLEGEWRWMMDRHILTASLALQKTEIETRDIFSEIVRQPSELYPKLTGNLYWRCHFSKDLQFGADWHYVSPRRASAQNILINQLEPYQLSDYQLLNLAGTWKLKKGLFGAPMELSARVLNLTNTPYAEPGFNGVDIPGQTRTFWLGVSFPY